MADLSGVTDKYFTIASETFTDNLSSSIAAGAATVPVNNNSEYTEGDDVVLTVDPGTVNEATFIGRKSGLNFINCVWTEGNLAVGHSNGATVIDYDSATHHNAQSKGIKQFANSDGTLKTQPVRDALGLGSSAVDGWEVLPYTLSVTTGYNQGNRRYQITVANNDLRTVLSKGMWLRAVRGTAGATQCADLESGSSQYGSKASPTNLAQTDDITCEAWVNLESYAGTKTIMSRINGTTNGWTWHIDSSGRVFLGGARAADDSVLSLQSVPLARWVHLASSIDSSGASGVIYMNGVSVGVTFTNNANTAFLTPTADFRIGAGTGATNFFDGKLSDVRLWDVVRTSTQIKDNMNQQLVGSETNLVGYWKLDGNFNDSTSNANNLTAQGGAVATTADTPMGNFYGKIVDISYSAPNTTITVQAAEGYDVPNLTLTAPYYSTQESPYGSPNYTKFRLSVWEATPANDVATYILEEATDLIRQVNTGNAGGTMFYRQMGTKKELFGNGHAGAISGTGFQTTLTNVTFPTGFFTSILSDNVTIDAVGATQFQWAIFNSISTTTAAIYFVQANGTNGTNAASIHIVGT